MAETTTFATTGHHCHPYGSAPPYPHQYPSAGAAVNNTMYPYPSGGTAAYHRPYPTPTHPPPLPRYSVVPWSSSSSHPHGTGGYCDGGSCGGGGGNRISVGPSLDPSNYRHDPQVQFAPDVLPYEVPSPYEYPTPAFDRRYYPRNPSPVTGHHHHHHHPCQLPHHPPSATATTQQHYHRPTTAPYPHPPSPSSHHAYPLPSMAATPMHQGSMQRYPSSGASSADGAATNGTRGYSQPRPVRRISILPPAPAAIATATTATNKQQLGAVPQVTTHKKKSQSKRANLAASDKSPTTMSFERILECGTAWPVPLFRATVRLDLFCTLSHTRLFF
jgi:hypothetical protein